MDQRHDSFKMSGKLHGKKTPKNSEMSLAFGGKRGGDLKHFLSLTFGGKFSHKFDHIWQKFRLSIYFYSRNVNKIGIHTLYSTF